MQELKIRAWHIPTRRMLYFDNIRLCTEYDSIAFELAEASRQEEYKLWAGHSHLPSNEKAEYIFMLYTGRLDKKGREIYAGDRVRWHTYDGYIGETEVSFRDGRFYPVASQCLEYDRYDGNGFEITSNIYEKPD